MNMSSPNQTFLRASRVHQIKHCKDAESTRFCRRESQFDAVTLRSDAVKSPGRWLYLHYFIPVTRWTKHASRVVQRLSGAVPLEADLRAASERHLW